MALTADSLTAQLKQLGPTVAPEPDVSDLRWRYRQAAAVLSYFDPNGLQPLGKAMHGESASLHLLLDANEKGDQSGLWILRADIRRAALERLATEETLQSALATNHPRSDDALQRVLDAAILHQSLAVEALSKDELSWAGQVTEWLRGIVPGLPAKADIDRRLHWENLVGPLRELAQPDWFFDRNTEKQRVQEFVKGDAATSLYLRPPLFIYGPAGIGKSTLLARYILESLKVDDGPSPLFVYLDFNRPALVDKEPLELRRSSSRSNQTRSRMSGVLCGVGSRLSSLRRGAPV